MAELLFLNFESAEKPVYMYISSPGTGGFETDAFAIVDTMNYVGPGARPAQCSGGLCAARGVVRHARRPSRGAEIETICLGTAFGTAAMLLANGKKGARCALPNAALMLSSPRGQARGQASDIRLKAREVLANRDEINAILAEKTGQPIEKIQKDTMRKMYLNADQALQYGLIDKILRSDDDMPVKPTFLSAL